MIITIDGPAGAGKSSVARTLAERLGFRFLDTGAMYRAVTLAAIRRAVPWHDATQLAEIARGASIEFAGTTVLLDGEDVSAEIRTAAVTDGVRHVASLAEVRRHMVDKQRGLARGKNIVVEGRDQGTVAFPRAECKFFLTASPEERARRRLEELSRKGHSATLDAILAEQEDRDRRDQSRTIGPLAAADDALEIITDNMPLDAVVARLEQLVAAKIAGRANTDDDRQTAGGGK